MKQSPHFRLVSWRFSGEIAPTAWKHLKPGLLRVFLLLAGILISGSCAHAAHYEEEFLGLPSAETEAAARDYDHFFRVIRWANLRNDASIAFRIWFSHHTANEPERGFIVVKIRASNGDFWEKSRALTEKEVTAICHVLDREEIFSLPVKKRFFAEDPYDPGSGP